MYRVISYFEDLTDGRHAYNVGDAYPREGLEVTEARINELATAANKLHKPLIEKVEPKTVDIPAPIESEATETAEVKPKKTRTKKNG